MFGKKDEYDGFGNYRQSDDYGHNQGTNTEDVKKLFQPYLKKDENILYSTGDGSSDESIVEKLIHLEGTKTAKAITAAYSALLIGGILMCMLGHERIGLKLIALFVLTPIVGAIVLLIIYCAKPSSVNCVITDKRVISMIGSQWEEIALKNVFNTSIQKRRNNTGTILVRSEGYRFENDAEYIFIYKVYDPKGVKQLLDEAVQRAKTNNFN